MKVRYQTSKESKGNTWKEINNVRNVFTGKCIIIVTVGMDNIELRKKDVKFISIWSD